MQQGLGVGAGVRKPEQVIPLLAAQSSELSDSQSTSVQPSPT
jgi:hypothetical protein